MADTATGDTIVNRQMGGRMVFRRTAADTGGELLEFDFFLEPGKAITVEHLHPKQNERFEVIKGTMEGTVNGEPRTVTEGGSVAVEPGTPHGWWNGGAGEAHLRVQFRPAMRTETFFRAVFALAADGKAAKNGMPRFPERSVILRDFRDEVVPVIPKPALALNLHVIGPLAGALGFRPDYSAYEH